MVEALTDGDLIFRGQTPTPSQVDKSRFDQKEPSFHQANDSSDTNNFYDSPLFPRPAADSPGLDSPSNSTFGDASEGIAHSSPMPDQSKSTKWRSSRSTSNPRHRPPNSRPLTTSTPPSYAVSAPHDNLNPAPAVHYPYTQRPGYGQYTMSTPPAINMDHPYGYPHPYHLPDTGMMTPTIHASYQPMLQTHASVYPYQHHTPDGASGSHASFSNAGPSSIYPHQQLANSPPPPPSSGGQPSASSYSSGPFHSLRYSAPMSTPQYAYPTQPYSTSPPIYSAPYTSSPYAQHYSPSPDPEHPGTWWYLPHAGPVSPQPQYETYPGHYPMSYPTMRHHEVEPSYSAAGPSSPTASHGYPIRPSTEHLSAASSSPQMADPSTPSADASSSSAPPDKPVVRRSYHPNPPAHRSEWVMWTGNVPSDATHDELWRFFNQPPEAEAAGALVGTGVLSIFLISRSSCAFVNFESAQHLQGAIARFNGESLRPLDPRCPKLVCRVRKKDDDLKAGVGGQRGNGLHMRWVKEQKAKTLAVDSDAEEENMAGIMAALAVSSDDERSRRQPAKHSSSGSYTSTNSSVLARYFPQRYFILKSLTQFDLDLSVEKCMWATQKHNEGILDQAYRTSQEVFLIFSVNKSGEFYGYAKMAGPIRRGEPRVPWASRTATDSSASEHSSLSPATGRSSAHSSSIAEEDPPSPSHPSPAPFFSPSANRLVDESPLPVGSAGTAQILSQAQTQLPPPPFVKQQSAPAVLGGERHQLTLRTPPPMHSLDYLMRHTAQAQASTGEEFELDPEGPIRAIRSREGSDNEPISSGSGRTGSMLQAVVEEEEEAAVSGKAQGQPGDVVADGVVDGVGAEEAKEEAWGESFKVEWLCTQKLVFHRTRHIRNPWNHDKEVKVSRDGTELEPTVGKRLLEEWERLAEAQSPVVPQGKVTGVSKRGARSVPSVVAPQLPAKEGGASGRPPS